MTEADAAAKLKWAKSKRQAQDHIRRCKVLGQLLHNICYGMCDDPKIVPLLRKASPFEFVKALVRLSPEELEDIEFRMDDMIDRLSPEELEDIEFRMDKTERKPRPGDVPF
jgi:hypothetical protein